MYNGMKKSDLLVQMMYVKDSPPLEELRKMTRKQLIEILNKADVEGAKEELDGK